MALATIQSVQGKSLKEFYISKSAFTKLSGIASCDIPCTPFDVAPLPDCGCPCPDETQKWRRKARQTERALREVK